MTPLPWYLYGRTWLLDSREGRLYEMMAVVEYDFKWHTEFGTFHNRMYTF